jgi:hypothetical protein
MATYYVKNSGSDAASGLSDALAWQTITKVNSSMGSFLPGDQILFNKGDTWSVSSSTDVLQISQSGTTGSPITFGSYGYGASPQILAAVDASDPTHYGLIHISGCSNVTFKNITVDADNHGWYGIVVGADVASFGGAAQSNESNITIQGCSILDCYKAATYVNAIFVRTWNTDISNVSIISCTIDGSSNSGIAFYPGKVEDSAPYYGNLLNMYAGYNTITNCNKLNNGVGGYIMLSHKTTNAVVEHNTITSGASGHAIGILIGGSSTNVGYFPTGFIIRYNDINLATANRCISLEAGQAITGSFYYNKFYSSGEYAVLVMTSASPAWTGASLNFYNNTMASAVGATFRDQSGIVGVVTLKNNLLINTAATGDYTGFGFWGETSYLPTHSNNLYYKTQNAAYRVVYTQSADTYYTPAQIATWEATGVSADPRLTNLAGFDWTLQAGSPAINNGTDVGLTKDKDGCIIIGNPDIGCYEYGSYAASVSNSRTAKFSVLS